MKKNFLFILYTILFIGIASVHAKNRSFNEANVLIEGKIIDSLISLTPNKKIKVWLNVSKFPSNGIISPSKKYVLETQYNKHFQFKISPPADRFYVRINFESENTLEYWFGSVENIYILDRGDRIFCKLSNTFFEFSGKGSEKLNCQSEIFKCRYRAKNDEPKFEDGNIYIEYEGRKRDSIFKKRIEIVQKFSQKLGKDMTGIMTANCYGLRYYSWFRSQPYWFRKNPKTTEAFLNSKEYLNADTSLLQSIKPDLIVSSPNYCDFIFIKLLMKSVQVSNGVYKGNMELVFKKIKLEYYGIVREKLLTIFFLFYYRENTMDFLNEAIDLIKNDDYKEILMTVKKTKFEGSPFYPFELENDQGKIVKLSDFKDKILLLDFWYTGCINCINFNNALKPVVDKYKNNPNIKFVSVNIDMNKNQWKKSIEKGNYTHPESINLYVGGKENGTINLPPLIKKYNIFAYPTLFIIKNEQMYSAFPPMNNNEKLVSIIEKALKTE